MITILSPAKKMNEKQGNRPENYSTPQFIEDSKVLVDELRALSPRGISELMNVSVNIADSNYERYLRWNTPFTPENAGLSLFAYKGQAYQGLNAGSFSEQDIDFAQDHLRILSGLYGLLRPRDLIQPYRLEMSTSLKNPRGKDLYEFWNNKITLALNDFLVNHKQRVLLNLASNEYYSAINPEVLEADICTPVFKEKKGDQYKTIAVYAKMARGVMTRYIIENRIDDPQQIKGFDEDGYVFSPQMSTADEWVFIR